MGSAYLAAPMPPPQLSIPNSTSTVDVRIIDTNTLLYINAELFWQPKLEGFSGINAPIYCFLISNGNRHILFDLGVRPDWGNYAPKIVSLIKATTEVKAGLDVASALDSESGGLSIRSRDIEAIIWSHNHFDHIGDPSTFPPTTELIIGPGVSQASWPGYPSNPEAGVLDSDAEGRNVREIAFDTGVKIGRFDAFDFFGDGSFYLLDAPGHAVGHLCALARTTASPSSFVFMGADACHHAGVLRPTEYLPLPSSIAPSPFDQVRSVSCTCPGDLIQHLIPGRNPSEPFFTVARSIVFHDHDAAMDTVHKIQELDALDNVFVVLAHDASIRDRIPLFPEMINAWKARNLCSSTRWLFCADFKDAMQNARVLGNGIKS